MATVNDDLKDIIDKHSNCDYISHKIEDGTLYVMFQEKDSKTADGLIIVKRDLTTDEEDWTTAIMAVIDWKLDLNSGWSDK